MNSDSAGAATIVVIGILAGLGRRRSGATEALLFGSAAGVGFALQAAVTKVFVTQLGHGVAALLARWTIYVLIASAAVGFVLQQSAVKTGVLAPAMASSNAVTLLASIVFGITVFGETLSSGDGRLAPAVIGLGLGVAWLASCYWPAPSRRYRPSPSLDRTKLHPTRRLRSPGSASGTSRPVVPEPVRRRSADDPPAYREPP